MIEFIEVNNIILDSHHGSRKLHSTNTALATIYDHTYSNYYSNNYTALIQTDLSAAFDTVDHSILLDKLDFYGFRGGPINYSNLFCQIENSMLTLMAESLNYWNL